MNSQEAGRREAGAAEFQAPAPLSSGPLDEERLRGALIVLKAGLCRDLTYVAGVILNTGILSAVPKADLGVDRHAN